MIRTKRDTLTFHRAFQLQGSARLLPAGDYVIVTDEELIEGLSFPVYRRVASWILAPVQGRPGTTEMMAVDPGDVAAVHVRDGATADAAKAKA